MLGTGNAGLSQTYTWDGENRLVGVWPTPGTERDGHRKVEFGYDYLGRRIRKQVWTYNAGVWAEPVVRRYVYHGWRVVLELNGDNQPLRKYTWGLDLAGLNGGVGVPPANLQSAGGIGGLLAMSDPNDPNDPSDTFGDNSGFNGAAADQPR